MVKELPLSQGYVALVDDADYDRANQHKWSLSFNPRRNHPPVPYARRRIKTETGYVSQSLHKFLVDCPGDIDHRDGDGLNNQRHNLRETNDSLNSANQTRNRPRRSMYRGVYKTTDSNRNPWRAQICVSYKIKHLGVFPTQQDAAKAYDAAALAAFGEFARTNFPPKKGDDDAQD